MISACAAPLLCFSSLRGPFFRGTRPSLISRRHPATVNPSRAFPLGRSCRPPPRFPPPLSLSLSLLRRRLHFPFSFPDFPSLSSRSGVPCLAISLVKRLSVSAFEPSFSLVGQFHPLPIRAAHCSRVSRIAEVKPSDDFLAGTWFRALLFSSLSPFLSVPLSLSPSRLPTFIVETVVTDDRSGGGERHTGSVNRDETSEGETDFRDDRCHCQWRARERLTRVRQVLRQISTFVIR